MAAQRQQDRELDDFQYSRKIKSGVIAALLFLILSNKVSYKILDIIINVFANNMSVIDDNECPQIIGTVIMSAIIGFVIFIF
jgi:hypothetical protein